MSWQEVLDGKGRWSVELGDSLDVLRAMPDACVDAVVTDPPAGVAFMGKEWDDFRRSRNPADAGRDNVFGRTSARGPEFGRRSRDNFIAFLSAILAECLRVTKPGGRMLCWSIPRTMHWTGMAIEDAGWEIENTIAHVFGSGFPKGKSQLKPAREDWWLARKPAKNVRPLNIDECRVATTDNLNGGAYAKDGGRDILLGDDREGAALGMLAPGKVVGAEFVQPSGRWPANIVLSHSLGCVRVVTKRVKASMNNGAPAGASRNGTMGDFAGSVEAFDYADADGKESVEDWACVEGCPVAELDRQSGVHPAKERREGRRGGNGFGFFDDAKSAAATGVWPADPGGGASRFFNTFETDPDALECDPFFYQAKASRTDREDGCETLPRRLGGTMEDNGGGFKTVGACSPKSGSVFVGNNHPTVKSTPLMRHLVKLIAKPGEVVLDAFCGSGSTGRGAVLEGCRFIGVEMEEEYVEISKRRLAAAEATRGWW